MKTTFKEFEAWLEGNTDIKISDEEIFKRLSASKLAQLSRINFDAKSEKFHRLRIFPKISDQDIQKELKNLDKSSIEIEEILSTGKKDVLLATFSLVAFLSKITEIFKINQKDILVKYYLKRFNQYNDSLSSPEKSKNKIDINKEIITEMVNSYVSKKSYSEKVTNWKEKNEKADITLTSDDLSWFFIDIMRKEFPQINNDQFKELEKLAENAKHIIGNMAPDENTMNLMSVSTAIKYMAEESKDRSSEQEIKGDVFNSYYKKNYGKHQTIENYLKIALDIKNLINDKELKNHADLLKACESPMIDTEVLFSKLVQSFENDEKFRTGVLDILKNICHIPPTLDLNPSDAELANQAKNFIIQINQDVNEEINNFYEIVSAEFLDEFIIKICEPGSRKNYKKIYEDIIYKFGNNLREDVSIGDFFEKIMDKFKKDIVNELADKFIEEFLTKINQINSLKDYKNICKNIVYKFNNAFPNEIKNKSFFKVIANRFHNEINNGLANKLTMELTRELSEEIDKTDSLENLKNIYRNIIYKFNNSFPEELHSKNFSILKNKFLAEITNKISDKLIEVFIKKAGSRYNKESAQALAGEFISAFDQMLSLNSDPSKTIIRGDFSQKIHRQRAIFDQINETKEVTELKETSVTKRETSATKTSAPPKAGKTTSGLIHEKDILEKLEFYAKKVAEEKPGFFDFLDSRNKNKKSNKALELAGEFKNTLITGQTTDIHALLKNSVFSNGRSKGFANEVKAVLKRMEPNTPKK